MPGSAKADTVFCASNPADPWCSSTAGQQTLDEYATLTAAQRQTYTLANGPLSPNQIGGRLPSEYTDFINTGSNTVEATTKLETGASRLGRLVGKFPALKLLGSIGWGVTAFCMGYHWSDGGSPLFSTICGDDVQPGQSTVGFPLVTETIPVWKAAGPGFGMTTPGWYMQFRVDSNTGFCSGYGGTTFYVAPTGSSLTQTGSDCGLLKYYGAWKAVQQHGYPSGFHVATATGTCPTFTSGGGTNGATGCASYYVTEAEMDGRLRSTQPVPYTGTGGQAGAANLGSPTLTVADPYPMLSGYPSPTWGGLTNEEKAVVVYTVTSAAPSFSPDSDYYSMPGCLGSDQATCEAALASAGWPGTATFTTVSLSAANLSYPAGAVITQPYPATTSRPKTDTLTFTVNPDPLPFIIPAPGENETYDSYIARLVALGFVGVATSTELSETGMDPERGPAAVVRTQPITGTRVAVDDPITVYVNPATAPGPDPSEVVDPTETTPEGTSTSGDGIPGTTPGGCEPWLTNSIDLSPFNGVDASSKFPFAIFGYVAAVFEPLTASPVTPEVTWPISLPGVGTFTFTADASGLDSYMSIWRTLCAIAIWIGAVWLLAKSLLGLSFGSPAEALEMDAF